MSYSPIVIEQTARGEREYLCCWEGLLLTLPRAGGAGRGAPTQLRFAALAFPVCPSMSTSRCPHLAET